ncbi:MAG: dTDP-4-dehydrorhamnose reductase [Pseudomonadota bacterium]
MRLFIAGASGQVAQALLERADALNIEARAYGRPDLDLTDAASVESITSTVKESDVVINAAAYTAVDAAEDEEAAAFKVNAEGAGRLAALAKRLDRPFIHLSTDYVYEGSKQTPYVESDAAAPLSAYGRSKLEGERRVQEAHDGAVILRTAWVYSPFGKNFLKTMLRLAATHDVVNIVADQWGAPTNAFDIADGVIAISERLLKDVKAEQTAPRGVFHMTSEGEAVWADFAEAIFAASSASGGPSADVKRIGTKDYPTPAQRPQNARLNCDRLETAFQVRLPTWRDSVEPVVKRVLADER